VNPFLLPSGGTCVQVPGLMYPDPRDHSAVQEAVETCLNCPAYLACTAYAETLTPDTDPGGVIAALTFEERDPANAQRTCHECGETKPLRDFGRHSGKATHRRTCKGCMADRSRELRLSREEVAA